MNTLSTSHSSPHAVSSAAGAAAASSRTAVRASHFREAEGRVRGDGLSCRQVNHDEDDDHSYDSHLDEEDAASISSFSTASSYTPAGVLRRQRQPLDPSTASSSVAAAATTPTSVSTSHPRSSSSSFSLSLQALSPSSLSSLPATRVVEDAITFGNRLHFIHLRVNTVTTGGSHEDTRATPSRNHNSNNNSTTVPWPCLVFDHVEQLLMVLQARDWLDCPRVLHRINLEYLRHLYTPNPTQPSPTPLPQEHNEPSHFCRSGHSAESFRLTTTTAAVASTNTTTPVAFLFGSRTPGGNRLVFLPIQDSPTTTSTTTPTTTTTTIPSSVVGLSDYRDYIATAIDEITELGSSSIPTDQNGYNDSSNNSSNNSNSNDTHEEIHPEPQPPSPTNHQAPFWEALQETSPILAGLLAEEMVSDPHRLPGPGEHAPAA